MKATGGTKKLVLVGGGHAHLWALKRTRDYIQKGLEVALVCPEPFWYSGMGPGMLSGFYTPEDDTVDVGRLVQEGGGRWITDRVVHIDVGQRRLELADSGSLYYDLLSLSVGSKIPLEKIPGSAEHGLPVKPVKHFTELRRRLLETVGGTQPRDLVVIGGGTAGCETSANALQLVREHGAPVRITLISAAPRLLADQPWRAGRFMERWLRSRDVKLLLARRALRVSEAGIRLDDGSEVGFDILVVATGIRPPRLLRESDLATAEDGAMLVKPTLESISDPGVFGGGDCVRLVGRDLPRVGVYGVKQAPILHRNLLAAARGEPLRTFRPQKRFMLILNLGDGTGLLLRGPWVLHGRWVFRLKDWIDRRFLRRFRR